MAQNKGHIISKSPATLNWFKNVGKSLGYSSVDLIQTMIPATAEFAVSTAESTREVASQIREFKASGKRISDLISSNDHVTIARDALKNAIDDIKSGKIYNKERKSKIFEMDEDFFFDDDFSFDDTEFETEEDENGQSITKVYNMTKIDANITKNSPLAKALDRQTEATLKAAQAQNDVAISIASTKMIADRKLGASIIQGLNAINQNLSMLVNFQSESMSKYIGASLKYYEESLNSMRETLEVLKRSAPASTDVLRKQRESASELALLSRGGLNFKSYLELIKKQANTAIDENLFLSPIKTILEDKDTLKMLAASPISFISTSIVSKLVPRILKTAMEDFDKTFSNFFPALLSKIGNLADRIDNPLLELVGQIFGIRSTPKSSISLAEYNKGAIPFDGYTKKAITEVIPGYLRKILAILSNREEIAFDYENGVFKSVSSMRESFERQKASTVTLEFSDVLSTLRDKVNKFNFESYEEKKAFNTGMEKFFIELARKGKFINPLKRKTRSGEEVDELTETYDFDGKKGFQNLFRELILSLPRGDIMRIFGSGMVNASGSLDRLVREAEENPLKYNAYAWASSLGENEHLEKDTKGKFRVKPGGSALSNVDKYNVSSLDYLRDIKDILLKGIIVYPDSEFRGGKVPPHIAKALERMRSQEDNYRRRTETIASTRKSTIEEIKRRIERGETTIFDAESMDNLTEEELASLIGIADVNDNASKQREGQRDNVLKFASRLLRGKPQERFNAIREKIEEILNKPAKLLAGVIRTIDQSMFKIVFGADKDREEPSFMSQVMANLRSQFAKFGDWMQNSIFNPLKESLFGKDGLITQFKNSATFDKIKGNFNKMTDWLFGKKVGENGEREGGLFPGVASELTDILNAGKHFFTGKAYKDSKGVEHPENNESVFGHIKHMAIGFKNTIKEYLFGKDGTEDGKEKLKGVFTGIADSVKNGFQNFLDALFGPKKIGDKDNQNYVTIGELTKKVKERAPKSLAIGILGGGAGLLFGGKLGLLGSILLPGGPLGGAIIATSLGFLGQSERFKNWLFGEKDENGERQGGFITKGMQDWMKKNKVGLIGGATLGALKSTFGIGLLPSFMLPGGPIGGAILGIATSMITKSEKFQNFMFGEKDEKGERQGGLIKSLFGAFSKDQKDKNLFGNMGAGALSGAGLGFITSKLGLLGSFFLPGGPIGGAIIGAASGIALSSDRWKKAIFGEFDDETGLRKGGLITKFINWTQMEVLQPLKVQAEEWKVNIQDWFEEKIAEPFLDGLVPIKEEFRRFRENLSDAFKKLGETLSHSEIFKSVKENLFDPIINGFQTYVFDPFKRITSTLINASGRILGSVISAPFKAFNALANSFQRKHEKQGIEFYTNKIKENIKNSDFAIAAREFFAPAKKMFDNITDYAKQKLSDTFEFLKETLTGATRLLFKTAGFILTSPFQLVKGVSKGINYLRGRYNNTKSLTVGDGSRLDAIRSGTGEGGKRGFLESIGDLIEIYTPFSRLRHDARYSEEGANYADARRAARLEREEKRKARSEERRARLQDMKDSLNVNRQYAKAMGYDNFSADGKDISSIYKDIDKVMGSKYGKEWRNMTKVQRDEALSRKLQELNTQKISDNTGATVERLDILTKLMRAYLSGEKLKPEETIAETDINKLWNPSDKAIENNPTAKTMLTVAGAADNLNDKEEAEKREKEEQEKTLKEAQSQAKRKNYSFLLGKRKEEEEKEFTKSNEAKQTTLLQRLVESTKSHTQNWLEMFGKKGLIGMGLIAAIPLLLKLLKDPSEFLGAITGGVTSFINYMNNNPTRQLEDGTSVTNDDFNESLIVGGTKVALRGTNKIATGIDNIVKGTTKFTRGFKNALAKTKNILTPKHVTDQAKAWRKMGIKSADDLIELGVKSADDLASMGIKGADDLVKLGIKGSDDLAKIGIKSADDLAKLGIDPTRSALLKLGVKDQKSMKTLSKSLMSSVSDQAKAWSKIGIKSADDLVELGVKSADDLASMGIRGAKDLRKLGVVGAESLAKIGISSADDLAKVGISTGKAAKKIGVKIAKDDSTLKTITTVVSKADDGLIKKFIKLVQEALPKIVDLFAKSKVLKAAGKALAPLTKTVNKFLKPQVLISKIGKIAKGIGKVATSAATLMIADIAFIVYGGVSGAFEAAKLFDVREERVDAKMRAISAGMKALLNVSWAFVIDILNDITTEFAGVDFIKILATLIYKAVSDDEDSMKLDMAQAEFIEDMNRYNEEHGTNLSLDAYDDMVNKTLGKKIGDFTTNAWNKFKSTKVGGAIVNDISRRWDNTKKLAAGAWSGIKQGAAWVGDKISTAWNNSALGNAFNNMKNDELIRKNLGLFDNTKITLAHRIESGIGGFAEKLTFGALSSEDVGKFLEASRITVMNKMGEMVNKVKEGWTKVSKIASDTWDKIKTNTTKAMNEANIGLGKFLGYKDENGNDITFTQGLAQNFKEKVEDLKKAWDITYQVVSVGWGFVKERVSDRWNEIKEKTVSALSQANNTLGRLLGYKDEEGNDITFTQGFARNIDKAIDVGKSVWNFLSTESQKLWENVKTTAKDAWDSVKQALPNVKGFLDKTLGKLFGLKDENGNDVTLSRATTDTIAKEQIRQSRKAGMTDADIRIQLRKLGYNESEITTLLTAGNGPTVNGGFGEAPNQLNNFVYYSQNDDRWKQKTYDLSKGHTSNATISARGCGPTSMAMVLTQLTGQRYEPPQLAKYAQDKGHSVSAGTAWSFFDDVARDFNLSTTKLNVTNNPALLESYLRQGIPVILSGRRSLFSFTESPFTTGGHFVVAVGAPGNNKVLINDPRGPQYSKAYDIKKVAKEARAGWAFKYNGGPIPLPSSLGYTDNIDTSAPENMSIWDLLGKMVENFNIFVDNVFNGTSNKLTWGNNNSGTTSPTGVNLDFIPQTLQDKILKKTAELTIRNESGGNYYVVRNDVRASDGRTISPSIGILQWRGPNAKRLMEAMYNRMPNNSEAKYFATQVNWNDDAPWSSNDQVRLSKFLKDNSSIAKEVQDQMALDYIRNTNLSTVYKHASNKITDPRIITFLGDIANTGPDHIEKFMNVYRPTTGGNSFEDFYKQFMEKSYWGPKPIYKSRLQKLYNELANWDPEQQGGLGSALDTITAAYSNEGKLKANSLDFSKLSSENIQKYISSSASAITSQVSEELLRRVVSLLESIDSNTDSTSQGIRELVKKEFNIKVVQSDSEDDNTDDSNVIVLPSNQQNISVNPMMEIVDTRKKQQEKDYSIAKAIAKGR